MTDQIRVFVSHHHSLEEDAFTARLVADLQAAGADVWVDNQRITSDDFVKKINDGLTGRQWLVLVMTPAAIRSSWVHAEVNAALHQVHSGRMLGVVPIVAEKCAESEIPALWATLQRYEAVEDYQSCLPHLLRALDLQAHSQTSPDSSDTAGTSHASTESTTFDVRDLWDAFWGKPKAAPTPSPQRRRYDLRYEMTISFEEAVRGCQKEIEYPRWEACPTCHGQGQIVSIPCKRCDGQGRIRNVRRFTVNIPAGVDDGTNVRCKGEGSVPPHGGAPDNLYVALSVKPHEHLKRQGKDIVYELPISEADAAFGVEVEVPTVDGKAPLKIRPGVRDGQVYRLKGKGAPVPHRKERGDELVIVWLVKASGR